MAVGSKFARWLTGVRHATARLDADQSCGDEQRSSDADLDRFELLRKQLEQQAYFTSLMEMTCAEVMRTPVTSVTGDQTTGDALNLLDGRRIKLLPVIDSRHRLIGVVTRTDLQPFHPSIRIVSQGNDTTGAAQRERKRLPVRSVMSTAVARVDAATPVADVITRFMARGHHHMPVVRDDKNLVGMLTQLDIVAIMCRKAAF
ncbi:HPP family protein [Caballeronia choica]|jgi:CBS-domain-containing membrane protein|uniref:HPP family protein n=1 Tax=Caballeronia choica TaxID=326476 RepID=A0A158L3F6_9BURK|nr:CBS domain-containing protein [Caballeronia choica]SAL87559.1 HPP family protein [Caballeronia choica]